jgi:aminoglycoside 6'-N-acetyltransferase
MDSGQFPGLATPRLLLRRFRPSDAASFFGYRTLPEVARYQSARWLTMTMKEAAEFVAEQVASEPFVPESWFQVAVERASTGELIGDIGLHTPADAGAAEVGYTLAPAHQHQGYAIEAVRALVDWLFKERRLHRVVCIADMRNAPSIRLMEKLGMRREGCADGEVRFAISNDEWT